MLTLLTALALASPGLPTPPEPSPHRTALLLSPIGPASALVARALHQPAFEANLRLHHMHTERLGWTLQGDFLSLDADDMTVTSASLLAGPRVALRGGGLEDWSLTPFGMLATTRLSAAHHRLADYLVLGLGVDAARTWVWGHFTMDLGLGLYGALPVRYRSPAEVLADQEPVNLSPVKPRVIWSIGYAF